MINIKYGLPLNGDVNIGNNISLSGALDTSSRSLSGEVVCNAVTTEYVYPHYEGPYVFTPTQSTQTINTDGKVVDDNITINPIPEYYGLITWNGSFLTVS